MVRKCHFFGVFFARLFLWIRYAVDFLFLFTLALILFLWTADNLDLVTLFKLEHIHPSLCIFDIGSPEHTTNPLLIIPRSWRLAYTPLRIGSAEASKFDHQALSCALRLDHPFYPQPAVGFLNLHAQCCSEARRVFFALSTLGSRILESFDSIVRNKLRSRS